MTPAELAESVRRLVTGRQVIMASNRGPVEFVRTDGGAPEARRGSGGVVTALSALAQSAPLTWIASPMTDADREIAQSREGCRVKAPFHDDGLQLRFVLTAPEAYERYYNVFANPLLWFLQHYMWDGSHGPNINAAVYDAWEHGYAVVNRAFADVIVEELNRTASGGAAAGSGKRTGSGGGTADRRPVVLFQDYHLYLAPGYVRERVPDALLQHFIHIPWPSPQYWLLLPEMMRLAIVRHLCQNDIIGLQSERDAANFLFTVEQFLPDATVDFQQETIRWQERTIYVRAYPVSIDVPAVRETAASAEAEEYRERLRPLLGEQTIVRVDRLEPSKNIVRGFMAFDGLLSRYPELAGRVKFWAFLVPSRGGLKAYQQYAEEVFALIDQINARHGNDAWKPIEVFYENNYVQALAGMSFYDVMLVNSVIDGMNLVAKEGPTVNQQHGVLVLSEGAGAYEQLGKHALAVGPADVEGTIRALYAALTMPAAERRRRAEKLRETVAQEDLNLWMMRQVDDLLEWLARG